MSRKIQFKQWLVLAVAWQFMALWICVYDHLAIHSGLSGGPAEGYSFSSNFLLYSSVTFIASLIGGSLLVFYINPKFANRSYASGIFVVVLLIITVMMVITALSSCLYVLWVLKIPVHDNEFISAFWKVATDPLNLKDTLIWATITAITQFIFQMHNKFGPGILWKVVTGKYRLPKTEEKIFMFLDLDSSTTIAESLGEATYHRLLKDFFKDITRPIVEHRGEIYQYVGDEIVVSWDLDKGSRNNNAIEVFFEIKKEIAKRHDHYYRNYRLVPSFKAGMHAGQVVAGEIGIVKRDITFSGDVLNTTSRIRSMCKGLDVELIVSSELLQHFQLNKRYRIRELGSIELKGKRNKIGLNSIERRGDNIRLVSPYHEENKFSVQVAS